MEIKNSMFNGFELHSFEGQSVLWRSHVLHDVFVPLIDVINALNRAKLSLQ